MTDDALLSAFLEMMAAERGAARNTVEAYRRDLEDFTAALHRSGHTIVTADCARINGYLRDATAAGLSAASRARRLSAIRQLYRF
ncbi:MAG TPA: site-specific integrase, partial [Hyphomicrobiaceae bacterium]|nr:site-specific integrase [Hyphomicrobiaceae bacterium]